MLSVGVNLLKTSRIERVMKNPHFCRRVLESRGYNQLAERGFPVISVMVSFYTKEALFKALGTGVRSFLLREAQPLHGGFGRPSLYLEGVTLKVARSVGLEFSVSATHTARCVSVTVIGEKCCSRITIRKRRDMSAHGENAATLTNPAGRPGIETQRKLISSAVLMTQLGKE